MSDFKKQLLEKLDKEDYLLSESPEINIGERLGWTKKFFNVFPALENKNYRLYFIVCNVLGNFLRRDHKLGKNHSFLAIFQFLRQDFP